MDRLTSVQLFIQNAKVWDLNLFCGNENQGLSPFKKRCKTRGQTFVSVELKKNSTKKGDRPCFVNEQRCDLNARSVPFLNLIFQVQDA